MEGEAKKRHARKSRAGKLLTSYLDEIAKEETELVEDITPDGVGIKMATKAEAVARRIWEEALGPKDTDGVRGKPDKAMMGLIFERLEGKAPPTINTDPGKLSVAGRVGEQGAKRINTAGGIKNAGNRGTKADS